MSATSVIEDARLTAEELDLFQQALSTLLLAHQTQHTHRDRLATAHRAANLVDRIVSSAQALQASFRSDDRAREIDALTGHATGGDVSEFYQRLAKVKEYHRKYPDVAATRVVQADRRVDFSALERADDDWLDKKFTGDEGLGRYLDLHELHDAWNNLASAATSGTPAAGGWRRLTYLQFLAALTSFALSPALKSTPEYSKYLTQLLAYLSAFHEKVFPLADLDLVLQQADDAFARAWDLGQVTAWPPPEQNGGAHDDSQGIWCPACQKTYSKETVYTAHLTSKKHLKQAAKLAETPSTSSAAAAPPTAASLSLLRQQKNRALALKEALITALVGPQGPLGPILADTLSNTERRAALTDRERQTEIEEIEAREAAEAAAAAAAQQAKGGAGAGAGADGKDDDDDDGRIYNPLRLPLGWDGKPIPFWLYKLHGLGVEYKCEICSDFVYMGRKTFERHFQESRHAFGMRALGLPNTKHFHEITRIEDAIALAEKLKQEGKAEMSHAELTEELEDEEGNVYNRKTWQDLKRQGLIP